MAGSKLAKRPRREPDLTLEDDVPRCSRPLSPQSYRSLRVPSSSAIVVDFGSALLRAGFSSDSLSDSPRLVFPPLVARGRDALKAGITLDGQVGYDALASATRSSAKTPFDGSIPNNALLAERLLDGVLYRLGLSGEDRIVHPVVVTEPPCQPNAVRAYMTEIMFEAYCVPKLCLGIDSLFSYMYNDNIRTASGLQYARKSGLVVSCGYNATHVLPVSNYNFQPVFAKRINVGGYSMTSNFAKRLQFTQSEYTPLFSYQRVEALKHQVCYVSKDYDDELRRIRDDVAVYESVCKIVKVPAFDAGAERPVVSAEEQEKAKQLRVERGKKLSEMMRERNKAKAAVNVGNGGNGGNGENGGKRKDGETAVAVTDEESVALYSALQSVRDMEKIEETRERDEDLYFMARAAAGFESEETFQAAMDSCRQQVTGAKSELGDEKAEIAEACWFKKLQEDELIAISDSDLTANGLKRKRHIRALRGAAESRMRAKLEKQELLEKQRAQAEEIARMRQENPQKYLENLRRERAELADKIRRKNTAKEAGLGRRSAVSRERMRLLAQHAGNQGETEVASESKKRDKNKAEDTFGMHDSDWDVYRDMKVREDVGEDDSDNDSAGDAERLEKVRSEILEIEPEDEDPTIIRPVGSALLYIQHPFADEIPIVIDRIRTPEILFQPSLIGVEQCGIGEAIELVVNRFESEGDRLELLKNVFLTGGVAGTVGLEERLKRELCQRFPTAWGSDILKGIRFARNTEFDAWRGAAYFAEYGGDMFQRACITRQDYDEQGADYIREHCMGNKYVPTPYVDPVEFERKKKMQSYKRY